MRDRLTSLAVTAVSRYFALRDRLTGRVRSARAVALVKATEKPVSILSEGVRLQAHLVLPEHKAVAASLLICHGIGETVELWRPVQGCLAEKGIASLIFDYAGYGRSEGRFSFSQAERDAAAALEFLRLEVPSLNPAVLGFSLGSGPACALRDGESAGPTNGPLILCGAFTSFRDACRILHIPDTFLPAVWDNRAALSRFYGPLLVIHGDRDRLFPVAMAGLLREAHVGAVSRVVTAAMGHEDMYLRPPMVVVDALAAFLTGSA